jgi:hypothetical protein
MKNGMVVWGLRYIFSELIWYCTVTYIHIEFSITFLSHIKITPPVEPTASSATQFLTVTYIPNACFGFVLYLIFFQYKTTYVKFPVGPKP